MLSGVVMQILALSFMVWRTDWELQVTETDGLCRKIVLSLELCLGLSMSSFDLRFFYKKSSNF